MKRFNPPFTTHCTMRTHTHTKRERERDGANHSRPGDQTVRKLQNGKRTAVDKSARTTSKNQ
eukprot:1941924-Amphidinium_carterae.1